MKEEELDKIIQSLEINSSEKDAFFIYDYEKGLSKDGFIHSNKDGIILFAKELLKGLKKFDEVRLNKDKENVIYLEVTDWYFFEKEAIRPFIKPLYKSRKAISKQRTPQEKLKDKLSLFGYFLTIAIIVILVVIGFFVVFDWIINSI